MNSQATADFTSFVISACLLLMLATMWLTEWAIDWMQARYTKAQLSRQAESLGEILASTNSAIASDSLSVEQVDARLERARRAAEQSQAQLKRILGNLREHRE